MVLQKYYSSDNWRVYIGLNDLKTQKTFQSLSLLRRICSWKKS
jgi:hypothetical protein